MVYKDEELEKLRSRSAVSKDADELKRQIALEKYSIEQNKYQLGLAERDLKEAEKLKSKEDIRYTAEDKHEIQKEIKTAEKNIKNLKNAAENRKTGEKMATQVLEQVAGAMAITPIKAKNSKNTLINVTQNSKGSSNTAKNKNNSVKKPKSIAQKNKQANLSEMTKKNIDKTINKAAEQIKEALR